MVDFDDDRSHQARALLERINLIRSHLDPSEVEVFDATLSRSFTEIRQYRRGGGEVLRDDRPILYQPIFHARGMVVTNLAVMGESMLARLSLEDMYSYDRRGEIVRQPGATSLEVVFVLSGTYRDPVVEVWERWANDGTRLCADAYAVPGLMVVAEEATGLGVWMPYSPDSRRDH